MRLIESKTREISDYQQHITYAKERLANPIYKRNHDGYRSDIAKWKANIAKLKSEISELKKEMKDAPKA